MKEDNKKRKLNENQLVAGSVKFYVSSKDEKTEFYNKLDKAKLLLDDKISSVSNYKVLTKALEYFIESHHREPLDEANETPFTEQFQKYMYAQKSETSEPLVISTNSALKNIVCGVQEHALSCGSCLEVRDVATVGHVTKLHLSCGKGHILKIDSSPHVEGGQFLVNLRMLHAVNCSGLRYAQYERLCLAANMNCIPTSRFTDMHHMFCHVTETEAKESMQKAINEEIGQSVANTQNPTHFEGIEIITDARHGTRKNSAFSDVVALGGTKHKVINIQTVTKKDDQISQRHEMFGVKNMYKDFEEKQVKIRIHGHDRNSSVNKYLASEHPTVRNANDTWHATKGITKALKSITVGPKKNHGVTWHEQLTDKAAAIKTATYFAMKNCGGDPGKLQEMLLNIPQHYMNNHQNCNEQSRCRLDENYECSKCTLTDPVAINLLVNGIKKLQVYKTPQDYAACVDTHYVESFNNAALIYHDKRITFGEKEYKRRTFLSVLDWNENVDRESTSVVLFEDVNNPRRRSGHKNLKAKTFNFYKLLWKGVIDKLYT